MEYAYVAYTEDKRLVKGKLSAASEELAANLLDYSGYQVVSLREATSVFDTKKLRATLSRVKPGEIILFSRQLALLLESGTPIATSLELLQTQATNPTLKRVIGEVISDIRGGASLSAALSKHPRVFSPIYHRAVAAGEQSGSHEVVLRQMADYMERRLAAEKKVRSALSYPVMVAVIAIIVVVILVAMVFPTFTDLFSAFGADLPLPTRMLVAVTEWFNRYGIHLVVVGVAVAVAGWAYARSSGGKYQWHRALLRMPVIGRILLLNELARCCNTIALLSKVGLPLPDIMSMTIEGTGNQAMVEVLAGVRYELIMGESLSKPMSKRSLFLPMMVQMTAVGEETGSLALTLATVAQSYETEADDRISAAIGLIHPAMTVIIGLMVAFIALALVSAMYGIYGQTGL